MANTTIPNSILRGDISTYLSANDNSKGLLFGKRVASPGSSLMILMVTDALRWGYDGGAQTNESLFETSNYLVWLTGLYGRQADFIIGSTSGGGTVIPGGDVIPMLNPYDWRVGTITTEGSPLKAGDTEVTLDGTNGTRDFRGYNIEFYRGSQPDYTTNPGDGSVFYYWNRLTGRFALLNGAAQLDEPMRISPVLGVATASLDTPTITYNLTEATEIAFPDNNNSEISIIITPNGFSYTWATGFVFGDNWPEQPGMTGVDTIQIYDFQKINSKWICVGQSLNNSTL